MNQVPAKIIRAIAREVFHAKSEFGRKRSAEALREELHRRTLADTADFIRNSCEDALFCANRATHLAFASSHIPAGSILEFGVYRGTTINQLAGIFPDRQIYGFDSFLGLPEKWKGFHFSKENFSCEGLKPKVKSNVVLVQGWFDKTLPEFMTTHREPLALAHIDCDIYSSTVTVLDCIAPALQAGSVLVFDEFFNYPGFMRHEYKAFFEFVERHQIAYEFIGFSGQQVSIKILG